MTLPAPSGNEKGRGRYTRGLERHGAAGSGLPAAPIELYVRASGQTPGNGKYR